MSWALRSVHRGPAIDIAQSLKTTDAMARVAAAQVEDFVYSRSFKNLAASMHCPTLRTSKHADWQRHRLLSHVTCGCLLGAFFVSDGRARREPATSLEVPRKLKSLDNCAFDAPCRDTCLVTRYGDAALLPSLRRHFDHTKLHFSGTQRSETALLCSGKVIRAQSGEGPDLACACDGQQESAPPTPPRTSFGQTHLGSSPSRLELSTAAKTRAHSRKYPLAKKSALGDADTSRRAVTRTCCVPSCVLF